MTVPSVSVVIPSYGGAARLPVLLDALARQTFAGEWEALVVLDGVVDASREVIDAVEDVPVRVIELPENRGRPAALNAGFAAAQGEILIRCDDDLGVAPSFLDHHVAGHAGTSPVGIIGLCRDVLGNSPYARAYGRPANERLRAAAYGLEPTGWWKYWAANCSVTRASFERVGPYDERFDTYGWEDVDWGYRLHRAGVPVLLEPRLEVLHLAASSNAEIRVRRAYLGGVAHRRFDRKHGLSRGGQSPKGVPQRLWAEATDLAARSLSPERFDAFAAAVDRVANVAPSAVTAKAIAFLVEAAATAGYEGAAHE